MLRGDPAGRLLLLLFAEILRLAWITLHYDRATDLIGKRPLGDSFDHPSTTTAVFFIKSGVTGL